MKRQLFVRESKKRRKEVIKKISRSNVLFIPFPFLSTTHDNVIRLLDSPNNPRSPPNSSDIFVSGRIASSNSKPSRADNSW